MACTYDLFGMPDCSAETLLRRRGDIEDLIDVDRALDLLTPPLNGRRVSYQEYLAAFERDPYAFYPAAAEAQSERPTTADGDGESLLRRVASRVRRDGDS
jgi:hypothetical protein